MSASRIDVHGILERAGADPQAPEGSQGWALAQVDAAVVDLLTALRDAAAAVESAGNVLPVIRDRLDIALRRVELP